MAQPTQSNTLNLPPLDQMKDIITIEDILRFPWEQILFYTGIACTVIVISLLLYWLVGWARRKKTLVNAEDHLSAHEKAFLELKRLEQQRFPEKGKYRKYYFFLSEIFRHYIEDRFDYPAIDKTSSELIPDLPEFIKSQVELVKESETFLKSCDLAKFANHQPGISVAQKDRDFVFRFVRGTMKQADWELRSQDTVPPKISPSQNYTS